MGSGVKARDAEQERKRVIKLEKLIAESLKASDLGKCLIKSSDCWKMDGWDFKDPISNGQGGDTPHILALTKMSLEELLGKYLLFCFPLRHSTAQASLELTVHTPG